MNYGNRYIISITGNNLIQVLGLQKGLVTYGGICTAGSHTADDRASQHKHSTKTIQHDDAQQTSLDYSHVITVLNFK